MIQNSRPEIFKCKDNWCLQRYLKSLSPSACNVIFSLCLLHNWGMQKLEYGKIIIRFICFSITAGYILFLRLGQDPAFLACLQIIQVTIYSSKCGAASFSYVWHYIITDIISMGIRSLWWIVDSVTTFFKWLSLFQWEINIWQYPILPFN